MPVSPSNPPNYTNNANAAIPVYLASSCGVQLSAGTYTSSTLPSASLYSAGTSAYTTDMGFVYTDGSKWINENDYFVAKTRTSLNTTQPVYQANFYGATKAYVGMTDAQTFLNVSGIAPNGIEIGWNAGTYTSGNYVAAQKTLSPAWDLSNTDRITYEFGWYKNAQFTRVTMLLIDNAGSIMAFSSLLNGQEKPQQWSQVLLKSQFSLISGSSFNWSNVVRTDVRYHTNLSTADESRSMVLYRITAGGYTKPTVVISCDDIYSGTGTGAAALGLNAMLPTCIARNVKGTHFVTDTEILNGGQGTSYKMTQTQVQAWCNAGWSICCHNIQHRPFAIDVASYSKTTSVVTMVINWGSSTNLKGTTTGFTLVAGDYITVSRCTWNNVNGVYPVISVTQGASQTTITYDVGNSTAVPTVSVGDGGVISVNKYNVKNDNQLLRTMIKQQGYKTNDAIMAYTYGQNDEVARQALLENGVRIARTTGGNGTNPEYSTGLQLGTTQISRKNGLVVATKNTTSTTVMQLNSKMMTLPTMLYDGVLATVQSNVNSLVQTGGLLSIYWHGEPATDGVNMTDQAQIDLINYLADLRDAGTIDLITFDQLDAMISQRLNPNDIQN